MKMVVWLGKGMLYGNVPCTYVHAVYIYAYKHVKIDPYRLYIFSCTVYIIFLVLSVRLQDTTLVSA